MVGLGVGMENGRETCDRDAFWYGVDGANWHGFRTQHMHGWEFGRLQKVCTTQIPYDTEWDPQTLDDSFLTIIE